MFNTATAQETRVLAVCLHNYGNIHAKSVGVPEGTLLKLLGLNGQAMMGLVDVLTAFVIHV